MLKAKNARLTDRIIQVILITILKYSEVDIFLTALTASSFLYEPTETLTDRNTDHIEAQRLIQSTVEELVPIKIPVNGRIVNKHKNV